MMSARKRKARGITVLHCKYVSLPRHKGQGFGLCKKAESGWIFTGETVYNMAFKVSKQR